MKKVIIILVAISLLAYSCTPSSKGDSKSWLKNMEQLNKLKTTYPAYKELITSKIEEASKIYNSAKKSTDKDKKADEMRIANNMLTTGCIENLKNMKNKINDVTKAKKTLKDELTGKSAADINYANIILEECKDSENNVEKILNIKSDKLEDPCNSINEAYESLVDTENNLKKAVSNFKQKEANMKADQKAEKEKN